MLGDCRVLFRALSAGALCDTYFNHALGLCNGGVHNVQNYRVGGLDPSAKVAYIGLCLVTHAHSENASAGGLPYGSTNAYLLFDSDMQLIQLVCAVCVKHGHSASMPDLCERQKDRLVNVENQDRLVKFKQVFELALTPESVLTPGSFNRIEMGADGACLLNSMAYFLFGLAGSPVLYGLPMNIANYPLVSDDEVTLYSQEYEVVHSPDGTSRGKQRPALLLTLDEVKRRYDKLGHEDKQTKALSATLIDGTTWHSLRWHVTQKVRYEYTQNLGEINGWGWLREMLQSLQEDHVYPQFSTDTYVKSLSYDQKLALRKQYLGHIQKIGTFMGDYEIAAACQLFRAKINVFKEEYFDVGGASMGDCYRMLGNNDISSGSLLMYQSCIPSYYDAPSESTRVFNILAEGEHFKAVQLV